ncbi:secretion protein [Pseudomonas guariconensis]|uniref:secretion protein n=1 Tax=Pseudomonas guariconensis TaxID=1288410 RepID=UPI0039063641
MAWYRVHTLGAAGNIEVSPPIRADSREQAISLSGRARHHIKDVKVDYLGGVKSAFEKSLPIFEQVVVLAALGSKIGAGQTMPRAVKDSVNHERVGVRPEDLEQCETAAQYLTLLRFDPTAVLIVEAGEAAGALADSLFRASESLKERLDAEKEYGKALLIGLIYTAMGIGFMVGIPLWGGATMNDLIHNQKLDLRLNVFSDVVLSLHALYTSYYWVIAAVLGAVYFYREKCWQQVRFLPALTLLNERSKVKRGLEFVTAYRILRRSGFNNPQSFSFLANQSKGLNLELYREGLDMLEKGRELSEVFDNREWPDILHQNLKGFEQQDPEGRAKILDTLYEALKAYFLIYSQRISRVASTVGYVMMGTAIISLVLGLYMPITTFNAGLGH